MRSIGNIDCKGNPHPDMVVPNPIWNVFVALGAEIVMAAIVTVRTILRSQHT